MNIKRFTAEELEILRANPYTYKATPAQLRFTVEFKEHFWNEYENGVLPKDILRGCGYDPDVLGASRINGILLHIREAAGKGEGFRTESKPRSPRTAQPDSKPTSTEEELQQVKKELKYIRKEVDFLKKISSVRTSGKRVKS